MCAGKGSRLALVVGALLCVAVAGCGAEVTLDASSSPGAEPNGPAITAPPVEPTTTTTEQAPTATTIFRAVDPVTGSTIVSCETSDGSPVDLAAEPAEWLVWDSYIRWRDADDCPVRIDVVAHVRGSNRCGWRGAEFLTMGRPIGERIGKRYSVTSTSRFLWDPDAVLPRGPFGNSIPLDELPVDAVDTGFRLPASARMVDETTEPPDDSKLQLFIDDVADPATLYLIDGDEVEVWHKHPSLGLCG